MIAAPWVLRQRPEQATRLTVTEGLHPAENRGYRELYATARQAADHWSTVASSLGSSDAASALAGGAENARRLLGELTETTARYGLYGRPAAQALGAAIARGRLAVRTRALDRNQVLRLALLDATHISTLLAYLGAVAESRGDECLRSFCGGWEDRVRGTESALRQVAVQSGGEPQAALGPLDASGLGRAAHRLGHILGTLGEWIDRRAGARRGGS